VKTKAQAVKIHLQLSDARLIHPFAHHPARDIRLTGKLLLDRFLLNIGFRQGQSTAFQPLAQIGNSLERIRSGSVDVIRAVFFESLLCLTQLGMVLTHLLVNK